MARLIFACLLIGSSCHAAVAAESAPLTTAPRYVVKVKFLRVEDGKQIIAVDTEVTGTKGTPLKTNLGGKNGLVLKLDMRDVPGGSPPKYVARLKLVESKKARRSCCPHRRSRPPLARPQNCWWARRRATESRSI